MGRKKISLLVVLLLLIPLGLNALDAESIKQKNGYDNQKEQAIEPFSDQATVYFHRYDTNERRTIKDPIGSVSIDKAYQLKEELLEIENTTLSSLEKIQAQIQLLDEWNLLPQSGIFDTINQKINSYQANRRTYANTQPSQVNGVSPNVIICGPSITSFLTIGGPILPLHVLLFEILPPFWYNVTSLEADFGNGALITGFLGLLPVIAFYCSTTTIINAFGAVIGENTILSPFIALMLLHAGAGLSISVNSEGYPINVFDWAIGLSVTGLVAYIDIM